MPEWGLAGFGGIRFPGELRREGKWLRSLWEMSLTQQVPPACLGSDQVVFSAQTVVFVCSPQPVARGIHEGRSGLCPRFCLRARHGGVWDVWDVWDVWESIPTV